jgi:hypothetical protein
MIVLGAVLGMVLATVAPNASAPAATVQIGFRHCGTVRGLGARFELLSHRTRCEVARGVMRGVLAGKGQTRGNPSFGLVVAIQGWLCWGEEGGFRCRRLASTGTLPPFNFRHPGPIFEACPVGARIPVSAVLACTRVRRTGVRP